MGLHWAFSPFFGWPLIRPFLAFLALCILYALPLFFGGESDTSSPSRLLPFLVPLSQPDLFLQSLRGVLAQAFEGEDEVSRLSAFFPLCIIYQKRPSSSSFPCMKHAMKPRLPRLRRRQRREISKPLFTRSAFLTVRDHAISR